MKIIPTRTVFSPRNKGKTQGNKTTAGIGFPQIGKAAVEQRKKKCSTSIKVLDVEPKGVH